MNINHQTALVTGGTGFLGQRLAVRLHTLGYRVTALGRNLRIGQRLAAQGITFLPVKLEDTAAMREACRGQQVVFHCGALSAPWGRPEQFHQANVMGTDNVIAGCQAHQVHRLIHTSTPSIYWERKHQYNLPENAPVPARMVNDYARTKWLAEQALARAHQAGLPVVTIRPSGIFGPGDTSILPRIIRANNSRFLPVLTSHNVRVDITYVENVVDALLRCAQAPAQVLGKQYNITNDEPISLYPFMADLIVRLGYRYQPRKIPLAVAYPLAGALEWWARTCRDYREPTLTRYAVGVLAFSKTLDISAAKRDLGYQPRVSIAEAVTEVVKHWNDPHDG